MPLLRVATPALVAALAAGVELDMADLFQFTLADGTTTYYWTSWDSDLPVGSTVFSSRKPWLNRSKWNLVNTMVVPEIIVKLLALNDSFAGGGNIKRQIQNGLFDGASFLLQRVYMPSDDPGNTSVFGTMDIFSGVTAPVQIIGTRAEITCKGKNNLLDQYAPRNTYQTTCLFAFCDVNCTLSRATFTTAYVVGATDITNQFIPWDGSPPANPSGYVGGTVRMTSGDAAGQAQTIAAADGTGLTLVYPLYDTPLAGDTFTAFRGCNKTKEAGTTQSCAFYSNEQNFRGYPYTPPPNSAT